MEEMNMLEKTISMVQKYGFFKILQSLFIIGCTIYVIYNGINVDNIVQEVFDKQQVEHDLAMEQRRKIDPKVGLELTNLIIDTKCSRSYVIEVHNGGANTSGLSFRYGEMTYEETNQGVFSVAEDYKEFNLSRFPFVIHLYNNRYWAGSMDDMAKIDKHMSLRMRSNDAKYAAFVMMYGSNGKEIGFIGVSYTYDYNPTPEERAKLRNHIEAAANKVVFDLDMANIYRDNR